MFVHEQIHFKMYAFKHCIELDRRLEQNFRHFNSIFYEKLEKVAKL